MVHAIRFEKTGGPEVLAWQEVELGKPGQGQVRLKHTAVGLNYIDTYQRSGLYPMPLPSGLGSEAAGVVEEVGPGVSGLKPGDRVAYAGGPLGAYSEARVMPADRRAVGRPELRVTGVEVGECAPRRVANGLLKVRARFANGGEIRLGEAGGRRGLCAGDRSRADKCENGGDGAHRLSGRREGSHRGERQGAATR